MFARRPRRLIPAAVAAAVWAVSFSAPQAEAGRDGDPRRIDRLAASLEARAANAAQFGLQTGDPRFLRFGEAANVLANEAGVLRRKLAAGDVRAVRICTAKIGRVVEDIDDLEDRLPKRAHCGRSLRGARKAADRLADGIEDVYDDLEDEVEDLRFVRPVGFAGYAPRPAVPARPPVTVCPPPAPPVHQCSGYATCLNPNCDHGFPPGPAAPAWGGHRHGGTVLPAPTYRDRDVHYGPSRGLTPPHVEYGRPAGGLNGFDDRFDGGFDGGFGAGGGLYGTPQVDGRLGAPAGGFGDGFRDRDRFDAPRGFDGNRFDVDAVPALPAPTYGPQASAGWDRPRLGTTVNVSFGR